MLRMTDKQIMKELSDLTLETRRAFLELADDHSCANPLSHYPRFRYWMFDPHPTFSVTRLVLNANGIRAKKLLKAYWGQIEADSKDPILETLKKLRPFVDEGTLDQPTKLSPGEMMMLRYFIAASDRENPARIRRIKEEAMGWIKEARRRWKAGYSANPFTPEPIPRIAA